MTIFDDFSRIKKAGLPQILLLFGEDEELLTYLRDELYAWIHFDPEDLSQSHFDLQETDPDQALEEMESLPFFTDKRTVIFENLWDISTARKSVFSKGQLAAFERFLDQPVETTDLIIIVHGKLDARQKLVKKLKKQAALLEASPLSPQDFQRYFAGQTELSSGLIRQIAEKSNYSFSVMHNNLQLLKTYATGREISAEDVDRVLPKSLQDNIFDLTDLVFKGRINAARNLVNDLVTGGEDIIKILAILTNSYRLYYQVKLMQERNWPEKQQTSFLKIHPYRVKLANQATRRLSREYLQESLKALIKLDYEIKTSRADKKLLFEIQLTKLAL